jgi:hypothetical protein
MSEHSDRIHRAVELCVLVPVGVAVTLKDLAPTFVNLFIARGRSEVDRRQEQVSEHLRTARGAGEVALAFGLPMIKDKVSGRADAAPSVVPAQEPPATAAEPDDHISVGTTNGSGAAVNGGPESPAQLAIPGYDALSASQVVERLAGLDGVELDAVRVYETAHRSRRTILGKIEQLRVD